MLELAVIGIMASALLICLGYRAIMEITGNSHKGCWSKPGCRGNKNCIFAKLIHALKNPMDFNE